MALLGAFRARRLARRAEQVFIEAGWDGARAILAGRGAIVGGAWAEFAVRLYNRGLRDDAGRAIAEALAADPDRGDALIFKAELEVEAGRTEEAIATYRRLLNKFPGAALQALELARLLHGLDRFDEAKSALLPFASHPIKQVRLALAEIHYALGEHAVTVELLAPIVGEMRSELRAPLYGSSRGELFAEYQDVVRLHDDAYAAVHGREKVIESALVRGELNARAGVNYKLLGQARMTRPSPWRPDTVLRSVDEDQTFGDALIAAGEVSRGICHLASSELRRGHFDSARKLFDRAREEDDDNFAAYLGLGAAMDLAGTDALQRLATLPVDVEPPPELLKVVVDWPALTSDERRVVLAASMPLAGILPRLINAGAVARILPIDARLTDLPEMSEAATERFEDHRCLEAITGAAGQRLCASKVEDLLDIMGERDSVFAHELAHLAHRHAPSAIQEQIAVLFLRALEQEHVLTAYQTTNVAEFFAVAYTDYLAHEYGLPSAREPDDLAIIDDTFELIRALARPADG